MANYNPPAHQISTAGPGRPKGTQKKKLPGTSEMIAQLEELNFIPVIEQVALYRDPSTPASVKFKINDTFIKLMYPQLKTVAHSGMVEHKSIVMRWEDDNPENIPIEQSLTVDATVTIPDVATVDSPLDKDNDT